MSLPGFSLTQVPRAPHLADQPLLEALRPALPDRAVDEAISAADAGSGAVGFCPLSSSSAPSTPTRPGPARPPRLSVSS